MLDADRVTLLDAGCIGFHSGGVISVGSTRTVTVHLAMINLVLGSLAKP